MSTNSEVKNYFQDKIIKKYDILYDFWPKSMIVWHLGQKYDVRRNVWRLAALHWNHFWYFAVQILFVLYQSVFHLKLDQLAVEICLKLDFLAVGYLIVETCLKLGYLTDYLVVFLGRIVMNPPHRESPQSTQRSSRFRWLERHSSNNDCSFPWSGCCRPGEGHLQAGRDRKMSPQMRLVAQLDEVSVQIPEMV